MTSKLSQVLTNDRSLRSYDALFHCVVGIAVWALLQIYAAQTRANEKLELLLSAKGPIAASAQEQAILRKDITHLEERVSRLEKH